MLNLIWWAMFGFLILLRPQGTYSQTEQSLVAQDNWRNAYFGSDVACMGDTAVIGAYGTYSDGLTYSGAVYVYEYNGKSWGETSLLLPNDAVAYDYFGCSVDISHDTIIVGARAEDTGTKYNNGAAYIFRRIYGTWVQQAKLIVSGYASYDYFGGSVAISGDSVIVGAMYADPNSISSAGAAYVFTRNVGSSGWSQQGNDIKPPSGDQATFDYFGCAVDISGNVAVVGAKGHGSGGAIYIFSRSGGTWRYRKKFSGPSGSDFGFSVAVSGNIIVVGAPKYYNRGHVWIYTSPSSSGSTWYYSQQLAYSTNNAFNFGYSVDLDGTALVVGFQSFSLGTISHIGAVVVYKQNSPGGQFYTQKRIDPTGAASDNWGTSVALSGNHILVGAAGSAEKGIRSGAVKAYSVVDSVSSGGALNVGSGKNGATPGNSDGVMNVTLSTGAFTALSVGIGLVCLCICLGAGVVGYYRIHDQSVSQNRDAKETEMTGSLIGHDLPSGPSHGHFPQIDIEYSADASDDVDDDNAEDDTDPHADGIKLSLNESGARAV